MKVSVAIKTIGTGLAYEKSTASQMKSAGGELLRRAESIEEMEDNAAKYQELIMAVATKFGDESRHYAIFSKPKLIVTDQLKRNPPPLTL